MLIDLVNITTKYWIQK